MKKKNGSDADSHLGPPVFPLVFDGKKKTITIQLNVLLFQLHIYTPIFWRNVINDWCDLPSSESKR